jgi:hypothetical protein
VVTLSLTAIQFAVLLWLLTRRQSTERPAARSRVVPDQPALHLRAGQLLDFDRTGSHYAWQETRSEPSIRRVSSSSTEYLLPSAATPRPCPRRGTCAPAETPWFTHRIRFPVRAARNVLIVGTVKVLGTEAPLGRWDERAVADELTKTAATSNPATTTTANTPRLALPLIGYPILRPARPSITSPTAAARSTGEAGGGPLRSLNEGALVV